MTFQRFLAFLPAALCMAVIFWFSSQPGDEVTRAAKTLDKITPTIGKTVKISWPKVGHGVGYTLLGAALLYGFGAGRRRAAVWALAVSLLYAISDEFHQVFVPGRQARIQDVLIDVGAACAAILLITIVRKVIARPSRRPKVIREMR